jgi:hypothetical protein
MKKPKCLWGILPHLQHNAASDEVMMSSEVCEKSTAVPEFPWSLQAAAGRTPFARTNRWQCGLVTPWLALNRFCAVQH